MGAFDHVSDTDSRAILHEERKIKRDFGVKELSDYTVEELRAEIKRREGIVKVSNINGVFTISAETLNQRPMLFVDDYNDLMIQYPDGTNEYYGRYNTQWNAGGNTGHEWIVNHVRQGVLTPLGWL